MTNKKLLIAALCLVALFGCQAPRNTPTTNPNSQPGAERTVIVRPQGTPTLSVIIKQEPGVTGAAPTNTPAPPQEANTTPGAVGDKTAQAPLTPLPTVNVERPLLPTSVPTGVSVASNTPNAPKTGSVGAPLALDGATLTVTGTSRSGPNQGDLPRPGSEFLIVALTLQNTSDRVLTFDASQFTLRAQDGALIYYDDVTFQDDVLRTVNLSPNETRNASVVFQIPKGATGYTLVLGDPANGGLAAIPLN